MSNIKSTTKFYNEKPKNNNMAGALKAVALSPDQERDWELTRAALLLKCPAFTHIWYSLMNPSGSKHLAVFTHDIPTLGTDGANLIVNPTYFFKYNLGEKIFMLAHEIMHNVLAHIDQMYSFKQRGYVPLPSGVRLPYSDSIMNVAEDLIINDMLIESKIGTYRTDWLHNKAKATFNDAAVDVYEKLFKDEQKKGKQPDGQQGNKGNPQGNQPNNQSGNQPGNQPGNNKGPNAPGDIAGKPGQQGFDQHMAPGAGNQPDSGKQPGEAHERNEQEWKTGVAAAVASAKAQGKLPDAMEKLFNKLLEPVVSWQDKIQSWLNRKVGGGGYDWRKPDRRMISRSPDPIYAPSRSGHGCGTIVVGFDTSGSIYGDPGLIDRFLAEVGGMLSDIRPKALHIVWCDAMVHRVDEVDEMTELSGLKPKGGGGTSFVPVFDWVKENNIEPDALIYLTDGYGTFPQAKPAYDVLWGNISGPGAVKYPFGEVVDIPHQ